MSANLNTFKKYCQLALLYKMTCAQFIDTLCIHGLHVNDIIYIFNLFRHQRGLWNMCFDLEILPCIGTACLALQGEPLVIAQSYSLFWESGICPDGFTNGTKGTGNLVSGIGCFCQDHLTLSRKSTFFLRKTMALLMEIWWCHGKKIWCQPSL